MPLNDWYKGDPGLNRTMCPACGNDTHFFVSSEWNLKTYDGWEEDEHRRFRRHNDPRDIRGNYSPILNNDSKITCGSCGNIFTYLDGRQFYVNYERDNIESSVVPSSSPLPSPYNCEGVLTIPVAAYDIIGQKGFGDRSVKSFTSIISLRATTSTMHANWHIDMPESESGYFLSQIPIHDIRDVSVPISIDPDALMRAARMLHEVHLHLGDEEAYQSPSPSDEDRNMIPISINEANDIVGIIQEIRTYGETVKQIIEKLTTNAHAFGFQIVKHQRRIVMQVAGKPGRILKTAARLAGIEKIITYPSEREWQYKALQDDNAKHHGVTCHYSY